MNRSIHPTEASDPGDVNMNRTCPGLDNHLRPKPEYITCPKCGSDVEIWTDEEEAKCPDCGIKVSRNIQSCLDWCEYANKCKLLVAKKKAS